MQRLSSYFLFSVVPVVIITTVLLVCTSASSIAEDDSNSGNSASSEWEDSRDTAKGSDEQRMREGSRVTDVLGHFRDSGEGWNFNFKDENRTIVALENLALERIARSVDESPDQILWNLTGVLTEYRGQNYLLITRAVIKNQTFENNAASSGKKAASGESSGN